jgi:HlyD family type I secretion membrane fusion protein
LLEKSLVRRSEVLGLMRSSAGLSGELGELLGRVGDSKERIARAEQQIVQLRTSAIQKASDELQTTAADLDDVNEQIRAAQDVLARTEIRAPVRGIVVKLYHHTAGGVVAAGGNILELLPVNDDLVVQGRIRPADVTYIKEGQRALVRLTSLKQRLTPMVEGMVTYLSADIVPDTATGTAVAGGPPGDNQSGASFVVRVRVDQGDLARKIDNFRPTPGMPAELFVETGSRTFFDYLLRPLQDTLVRAFREK